MANPLLKARQILDGIITGAKLANAPLDIPQALRVRGSSVAGAAGPALESSFVVGGPYGSILAYDRTLAAYQDLYLDGKNITLTPHAGSVVLPDGTIATAKLADGAVTTAKLAAGAATNAGAGYSTDGTSYTTTAVNTIVPVPAVQSVTLTTVAGSMILVLMQLIATHTVAGAGISVHLIVDGGAPSWVSYAQVPVAGMMTYIGGVYLPSAPAPGSHTYQIAWASATAGTMTKQGWMTQLVVVELRK